MEGYVATIGMFDGVHTGHRFVLQHVTAEAERRGLLSMAVTFDHTLHREQVLTPLDTKVRLIRATGIHRVEVLAFTDVLRQMSARQFMQQVLRDRLGVQVLLTGYDNRFGHNRQEGFDDYVRYGQQLGMEVVSLPPAPSAGTCGAVSSSLIRQLLSEGRVDEASRCLGYPYAISGRVVHGQHIGTGLGFPTANLLPDMASQLIPANGVYAVRSGQLKGMMNIGTRPTFGSHQRTLEVHFLHYHADLYDRPLTVEFVRRLRDEQPFDSVEALKEQLQKDAIQAEQI